MATVKALSKEKVRRLTTVPDDFLAKIPKAQGQLYDEIVALLAEMEVKDGAYVINSRNLEYAAQIGELLKDALTTTDYLEAVTEFAGEFDKQANLNEKLFSEAFPSEFAGSKVADQIVRVAKRQAVELLIDSEYSTKIVAPLRTTIEQAVVNGAGYKDTLTAIREFVEGTPEKDGALLRYSRTYAHDLYSVSDASYTSVVSDELDAEWFFYSGDEIDTTRPFCGERHNEYFYYKEIESWFTSDPQPSKLSEHYPWSGMIPGTNESNIYSYRGGYGCRHSILPVSLYAVPLPVVERNIANGNFEPTDKQRELLGI